MPTDERQAAAAKVADLISLLKTHKDPGVPAIVEECESLHRAIGAFHMEAIRFRIFNVDRLISAPNAPVPPASKGLLEDARRHLEAAGFHTRSHQAPT